MQQPPATPGKGSKEEQSAALAQQQSQERVSTPIGEPVPIAQPQQPQQDPNAAAWAEHINKEMETWKGKTYELQQQLNLERLRNQSLQERSKLEKATAQAQTALKEAVKPTTLSPLVTDKLKRTESRLGKLRMHHKIAAINPAQLGDKPQYAYAKTLAEMPEEVRNKAKNSWGWSTTGTPDQWRLPISKDPTVAAEQREWSKKLDKDRLRYVASQNQDGFNLGRFSNNVLEATDDMRTGSMWRDNYHNSYVERTGKDWSKDRPQTAGEHLSKLWYNTHMAGRTVGDFIASPVRNAALGTLRTVASAGATASALNHDMNAQAAGRGEKGGFDSLLNYRYNDPSADVWKTHAANTGRIGARTLGNVAAVAALPVGGWTGLGLGVAGGYLGGDVTEGRARPMDVNAVRNRLLGEQPASIESRALIPSTMLAGNPAIYNPLAANSPRMQTYLPQINRVTPHDGSNPYYAAIKPQHYLNTNLPNTGLTDPSLSQKLVNTAAGFMGANRVDPTFMQGQNYGPNYGQSYNFGGQPMLGGQDAILQQLLSMYGPAMVQRLMGG